MTHPVSQPARDAGYETRDAEPRPIVLATLVLALVIGLALAASAWITQTMVEAEVDAHEPPPDALLPLGHDAPALQSQPARELRQQRAWEEEQLHGTAWVDPVNRVVRIPIESAMEKSLEEGFPVRSQDGGKR